jgi:hypothetical protein
MTTRGRRPTLSPALLPALHLVARRVRPGWLRDLEAAATRTWDLAPGCESVTPRAFFLPGQLDRVTAWAFADEHPRREMEGGIVERHGPTRAMLIRDAWLLDGVLYKGRAASHLHPRRHRVPQLRVDRVLDRAALYCTPQGNRYFGSWVMDDCPRYPLAVAEGTPITTRLPQGVHARDYEARLEMQPERIDAAHLREVVIFDDVGQNRDKHRRFAAMGDALRRGVDAAPHPGVFILRGRAGEPRILIDELELAHHLQRARGFRILDPMQADVATIIAACAGAQVVVGIEGSALVHGVITLRPGGSLLVLQPPHRFCSVFKHLTDRDGQHFGFVVGTPRGADFTVDVQEVERTLDLFPSP